MASEPTTNPIKFAIAALLVCTLLAVAAGMIIPFDVDQPLTIQMLAGDAAILIDDKTPDPLLTGAQTELDPGQTIQLQPGSEASITFTINKGRAQLTGPTTLTLIESYRRATSLGHAFGSFSRDYVLTLAQTQGTVRYIFANTSPALDEMQVTIQLPDGNYIPFATHPCWTITVDTNGHSTANTIQCPSISSKTH
ncbi:MAG: hypothetical protein JXA10_02295 [Anaerolineae bacterium]|nr:hypothetical protein [Anaerolineae bacterium]